MRVYLVPSPVPCRPWHSLSVAHHAPPCMINSHAGTCGCGRGRAHARANVFVSECAQVQGQYGGARGAVTNLQVCITHQATCSSARSTASNYARDQKSVWANGTDGHRWNAGAPTSWWQIGTWRWMIHRSRPVPCPGESHRRSAFRLDSGQPGPRASWHHTPFVKGAQHTPTRKHPRASQQLPGDCRHTRDGKLFALGEPCAPQRPAAGPHD